MVGAVDIGGTKIAVGIIDARGRVLFRTEAPTEAAGPYESALECTVSMLHSAVHTTGLKLKGIGIGSTGPVYPLSGEFGNVNFFPHWQKQNPVQDLEKTFGVSVAIENDADAAALGEARWGAGRNKSRLVYVTIGTGIGVGIILDGRVYRGVAHSHPEIGHHLLDPSGPPCECGFRGCWESLAAGPAMVNWLQDNAPAEYSHKRDLTAKKVCELASRDDEWACKAVEREARYLGLGLANLVTLLAPDTIVLGGSLMKSGALFLEEIRRIIARSCRLVPFDQVELALASLGEDSNLIGAAAVWHCRFEQEEGCSVN